MLPNTIEYNPTSKWPKYLHIYKIHYMSIICIYNQRTPRCPTNIEHTYNHHKWTIQHTNHNTTTCPTPLGNARSTSQSYGTQPQPPPPRCSITLHPHSPVYYKSPTCSNTTTNIAYTWMDHSSTDEHGTINTTNLGIYITTNNLYIAKRLMDLQNMLWAKLYAILITLTATWPHPWGIHILT